MGWNLADVWEVVADTVGGDAALVQGDRTIAWADLDRRADAIAQRLIEGGAKAGDKVAIYSYSRPEYVEAVFATFKARLVPANVNYRYRTEELLYHFDNSDAVAVIFEGAFAENLEGLRASLPKLKIYVQVDDSSPSVDWADDYETLATRTSSRLDVGRSPDDLLFIYTGGTTGMPKGVMWRQTGMWSTLGGGGDPITAAGKPETLAEHAANVKAGRTGVRP